MAKLKPQETAPVETKTVSRVPSVASTRTASTEFRYKANSDVTKKDGKSQRYAENGEVIKTATKELDPRLPLSERQFFSIKKSWKAIGRNMSETGVNMFVR